MGSILDDVKKMLGLGEWDEAFDAEILMHINSVFMTLNQLGVGPPEGYTVRDRANTWDDFVGDRQDIEAIKSYTYLKVRLLFDPPSSSFVLESIKSMASELEFRLNVQVDRRDNDGPYEPKSDDYDDHFY